jgi:hypothetical protein
MLAYLKNNIQSAFNRAYHNALYKVTLQEGVYKQHRHGGDYDGGVFYGFGKLVDLIVLGGRGIEDGPRRIDLFNNPVGCQTSLVVFQAKALQNHIFNGSCLKT